MIDLPDVVRLPSGARIVFDPMPGLRTASVGVWLGAGARHEPAAKNGLAHFLEHMAFKAAGGRNARELAEAVEARGAVMNAATDHERTNYYVRCLGDDAPDMLDVALALVFAPEHPESEIAREKGVVLQEIGEARDQPDDRVFDLAQEISYPNHALGLPILGSEQTLEAVGREDLFGFAATSYVPSRTVVAVAGAFDRLAVEERARHWLENRKAATAHTAAPPRPGGGFRGELRRLEQCHLVLARPTCGARDDQRFAARIMAEIFGGGMASRLFQQVREERGLAYAIDATCDQYSDAGRITVYAGCSPKDAPEVVRLVTAAWEDIAAAGVTDAELSRAKAVLKMQFAMAMEAPSARAATAAYELLTFDSLSPIETALARIDAVTVDDVRRNAEAQISGPATAAAIGAKSGLNAAERFAA